MASRLKWACLFGLFAYVQADCPKVHIFGARETNAPPGYGLTLDFINDIVYATDATSEVINYPADGDACLTDEKFKLSVQAGIRAVASQVSAFAQNCPSTELVLVGYSQGAHVIDDALCGGGDPNLGWYSTDPLIEHYNISAVLLPANDRFRPGEPFHVGNATVGGFDERPDTQIHCGNYRDKIQLYCDADDRYCTNGTSLKVHNGYYGVYGGKALEFVMSRLS